jgi:hypothetical protein
MNWDHIDPTEENKAAWAQWLDERPPFVRAVAERFNPWTMYKLLGTGQRAQIIGFHSDGDDDPRQRVTAYIYVEHPVLGPLSGRKVFGIDPEELAPWTEADEPPADGMVSGRHPDGSELVDVDYDRLVFTFKMPNGSLIEATLEDLKGTR